jgi:membrane protein implicated in regulation of membrane protease activity
VTPPTTQNRPPTPNGRPRPSTSDRVIAGILVLIPVVALMWVPSYAEPTPRLWGFPFFYWYQLLWLFISAACTVTAYLVVTRAGRSGNGSRSNGRGMSNRGGMGEGTE